MATLLSGWALNKTQWRVLIVVYLLACASIFLWPPTYDTYSRQAPIRYTFIVFVTNPEADAESSWLGAELMNWLLILGILVWAAGRPRLNALQVMVSLVAATVMVWIMLCPPMYRQSNYFRWETQRTRTYYVYFPSLFDHDPPKDADMQFDIPRLFIEEATCCLVVVLALKMSAKAYKALS